MFTWNHPESFSQSKACFYSSKNETDKYDWQGGLYMASKPDFLFFESIADSAYLRKFDYLPSNVAAPLVSKRVVDFLKTNCFEDFQPVAVKISCKDESVDDYFLINIINLIDIIDREKSTRYKVSGVFKDVVYQKKFDVGSFVARAIESEPEVLVSSELTSLIIAQKFKGMKFYPVEES
jgi:hypothetical protein